MTLPELLTIILHISLWQVLKIFILFALLIYFVFAIVVVRQVKIMTETFKTGFETTLRLISWLHLFLVLLIFLLAVAIL